MVPALFNFTDLPTIFCPRWKIVNVLLFNIPMFLCATVVNKKLVINK